MSFVIVVHMILGGDLPFMTMLITNVMVVAMEMIDLVVAALKMTKGK